jgi:hypothetical protein
MLRQGISSGAVLRQLGEDSAFPKILGVVVKGYDQGS